MNVHSFSFNLFLKQRLINQCQPHINNQSRRSHHDIVDAFFSTKYKVQAYKYKNTKFELVLEMYILFSLLVVH